MPFIPYEFDPPSADYEEAHLTFQDTPAGKLVSWPLIGASILLPKDTVYPEFSEIEERNRYSADVIGMSVLGAAAPPAISAKKTQGRAR
jgi:hypothetical protein